MVTSFSRGRPASLEEVADGVRDGDQPAGAARERAVDVAERPEQVAVVVVARRDERDARDARCDRAVDIAVHEVRVQQVGRLAADRPDDVARQAWAHVGPQRTTAFGTPARRARA